MNSTVSAAVRVHRLGLIGLGEGRSINETSGVGSLSPAGKALGQSQPDMVHFAVRGRAGGIGTIGGCYGAPHPPFSA